VQIAVNDDPTDANEADCESFYYPMQNANFNVIGLSDANGTLVERYEYTPYGQRTVYKKAGSNDALTTAPLVHSQRVVADGDTKPYGLCDVGHQGLMHDKEFGLVYNRNRYLDPRTGRWPQRDFEGYVDGMSLYEYAVSAPLRYTDPLGSDVSPVYWRKWPAIQKKWIDKKHTPTDEWVEPFQVEPIGKALKAPPDPRPCKRPGETHSWTVARKWTLYLHSSPYWDRQAKGVHQDFVEHKTDKRRLSGYILKVLEEKKDVRLVPKGGGGGRPEKVACCVYEVRIRKRDYHATSKRRGYVIDFTQSEADFANRSGEWKKQWKEKLRRRNKAMQVEQYRLAEDEKILLPPEESYDYVGTVMRRRRDKKFREEDPKLYKQRVTEWTSACRERLRARERYAIESEDHMGRSVLIPYRPLPTKNREDRR